MTIHDLLPDLNNGRMIRRLDWDTEICGIVITYSGDFLEVRNERPKQTPWIPLPDDLFSDDWILVSTFGFAEALTILLAGGAIKRIDMRHDLKGYWAKQDDKIVFWSEERVTAVTSISTEAMLKRDWYQYYL